MRNVKGHKNDDLIADVMSLLFPLVVCAIIVLVLIDTFACQ